MGLESGEHAGWSKRATLFSWKEVLCQVGVVNISVVLLEDAVITTQTRSPGQEACPPATSPHRQTLFDACAQPEDLLFH